MRTTRPFTSATPIAALLAALSLAHCASAQRPDYAAPVGAAGTPAPAPLTLSLETVSGEPIELAALRGKAVLLIAFNHDDLRSHATLRDAERVARAHPDSLSVIAICGNPGSNRTLRMMLETFAGVLELRRVTVALASDAIREGTSPLGAIEHVPTTILVNRAGVIARTVVGLMDEQAIESLVRPALPAGG